MQTSFAFQSVIFNPAFSVALTPAPSLDGVYAAIAVSYGTSRI